jgi:uncharacterized membrane protein (DUF2068 family)
MSSHPKGFFVRNFGLRGIAIFEALKGVAALGIGIWVITLLHKDMVRVAERMLEALHIGLDRHFAQRILHAAGRITDKNLWMFISVIVVYTAVRFTEAAGLWLQKEWAEWFALLSGALYMPYEIFELLKHATILKWGIFGTNAIIVLYMAWLLNDSHRRKKLTEKRAEMVD